MKRSQVGGWVVAAAASFCLACGDGDTGQQSGAMLPTAGMQGPAAGDTGQQVNDPLGELTMMSAGQATEPTAGMQAAAGTTGAGVGGGAAGMDGSAGVMNASAGTLAGGAGMVAGSGGAAGAAAGMQPDQPASGAVLPPVSSTEMDGPFESEVDTSGPHHVWRPTELGKDGLKHPVFVWGTGAGATPDRYNGYFGQFATHGIVVVAPTPASLSGSNMSAALNWILEQNDTMGSDYYQMLDPDRIGMGGHSQGSIATFDVEGMEDRLKTTIHIAGGSFDARGSSKVKTPTAYICGETDFALPNCETDFDTVEDQPTFFSVLAGVDHVGAARNAMPGMIAWLRWHLGGETDRAAQFTGPDGDFHQGIWVSQTKNWNY